MEMRYANPTLHPSTALPQVVDNPLGLDFHGAMLTRQRTMETSIESWTRMSRAMIDNASPCICQYEYVHDHAYHARSNVDPPVNGLRIDAGTAGRVFDG